MGFVSRLRFFLCLFFGSIGRVGFFYFQFPNTRPWTSIVHGILTSIILATVLTIISGVWPLGVISGIACFLAGIRRIPEGQKAILTILGRRMGMKIFEKPIEESFPSLSQEAQSKWGKRVLTAEDIGALRRECDTPEAAEIIKTLNKYLSRFTLREGYYWVIPIIGDVSIVDTRIQAGRVMGRDKNGKAVPPHVLAKDGTVQPEITYSWRVGETPLAMFQFLNVEAQEIFTALNDAVLSTFAAEAADKKTTVVRQNFRKKAFKKRLLKAADSVARQWFLDVTDIRIVDITLDTAVEKAINDRAREEEERIAEKIQAEFLRDAANLIVEAARQGGETISFSDAVRALQIEREKQGVREIAITGVPRETLLQLASAIARIGEER